MSGGPAEAPAIQIRDLRKVYGGGKDAVVAVDGLDLEVRRGEVFGLLGPNGAGKTTTVEICEGLLPATSGEVRVLGASWGGGASSDMALRHRLGVCLQSTSFFDKQRVAEVLELFASFHEGRGRSVGEVLEMVSLTEKARAFCSKLSGGQQQRLAVATALLGTPELLFLDEPTTGLDPQSRRQMWDVVRAFQQAGGSVLLTTHYMDEAEQLCDRVAVVDGGRRIAQGTPEELIRSVGGDHIVEVTAAGAEAALGGAVAGLPQVSSHRLVGDELSLTVRQVHAVLPALWEAAADAGLAIQDLRTRHATLEDVFVQLTGRRLRDGEET